MWRPCLQSNAVGKVSHHMELNTSSALQADGTPYLRNAPLAIMANNYLKCNFWLKSFILKLLVQLEITGAKKKISCVMVTATRVSAGG